MKARVPPRWGLLGLLIGAGACAPTRWEAAEGPVVVTAPLPDPLEMPELVPPLGVVFSAEWTETSTEGLADDPLEQPWLVSAEAGTPILAMTGTVSFDLPMSEDPSVTEWVEALQTRGHRLFRRWLARSSRYVPTLYRALEAEGLPKDLVFLAMVESGFSPRAHSWASASGPWQFMPVTGRRYGLRVGFWVDERRDFEKASVAAARHLSWLYGYFGDWHLAMAAYNAGAGRIRGAIKNPPGDFWALRQTRYIKRETREYVPKILASAIIAKDPERYGFDDVPYQPSLRFGTVTVTVATSLATLGEACGGLPAQALSDLNPSLRVGVTPPGETWRVRVPPGLEESCADGLKYIPHESRMTFRYWDAREGETVEEIARALETTPAAILKFHGVDDPMRMADYAEMAIPVPFLRAPEIPIAAPEQKRARGGSYGPGKSRLIFHRVRSGDSLWRVAHRYHVTVSKLRAWNGMWRSNALKIGQRLRVYLGRGAEVPAQRTRAGARPAVRAPARPRPAAVASSASARGTSTHRVAEGESLWIIARRHSTTVEALRQLNGLNADQVLSIGQTLRVR